MSDYQERRNMVQEERLRRQLEVQSQQIERVFSRHELPAQVAGGTVGSGAVDFNVQALATGLAHLRALKRDLVAALRVPEVHLERENGRLHVYVDRPEDPPVALLDLLSWLPESPPVTAALGVTDDGRPVLLDFLQDDVTHVLVAGQAEAGKTVLLRTIAMSLALTNKQSQLQLLIIDPETTAAAAAHSQLEPLRYLPHLLADVIYDGKEAADALDFLVQEMDYRQQQEVVAPTIVVLIDKVDVLLQAGGQAAADAVLRLAQRGAGAGIHLVLSTQRPGTNVLGKLLKANLSVRLVGLVADEAAARAAAGISGTQAELLLGQGDFLAVTDPVITRFQAASIGDYDLHWCLEELYRKRPPALLARPFNIRTTLPEEERTVADSTAGSQTFSFDGEVISLVEAESFDEDSALTLFPDEEE
jgi:S-DNA-T family DNA segregation ATPase FtsK/SpoIIIE